MIRIVLDSNLFVSALLKPGSIPDLILRAVRDGKVLLLMSEPIRAEIARVLTYPKIKKRLHASDEELHSFLQLLDSVAIFTPGTLELPPLEADPADTMFLTCAVEGHAEFIVSGDHHLTNLGTYRSIRIVTPADFFAVTRRGCD